MGIRAVKVPDVGEGVAEAEVVEWHVKPGDMVREDQVLAAVMTDKATLEIPAPFAGTIVSLAVEAGGMLSVGDRLVLIDVPGMDDDPAALEPGATLEPGAGAATGDREPAQADEAGPEAAAPLRPAPPPAAAPPQAEQEPSPPVAPRQPATLPPGLSPGLPPGLPRPPGEKPLAAPAVRRRALEAGIDLRRVRGSGPAGRILHEDLDAFLRGEGDGQAGGQGGVRRAPDNRVEEVPVIGMRRRIARRMAESTRRVAHFSYVEEVDVTALEALRASLNAQAAQRDRPRLTLLPFLVLALVRAVAEFPQMNAHYDDENEVIHRHGGVHAGIATQTDAGLLVPVLRHAEARDLWDCADELRRITAAAREGRASREALTGSTITITSLGALGGIVTTPVINLPEVAILGVNRQVVRPVWQSGRFEPRLMMNLSSSFDHRVVDGHDAARFIQAIRSLLEEPATIFVEG